MPRHQKPKDNQASEQQPPTPFTPHKQHKDFTHLDKQESRFKGKECKPTHHLMHRNMTMGHKGRG